MIFRNSNVFSISINRHVLNQRRQLTRATAKELPESHLNFIPKSSTQLPGDFPLTNPWRTGKPQPSVESEVQKCRHDLLEKNFPITKFPTVSQVLQGSMSESSQEALKNWKSRMTEELGEVGFIEHQRATFRRGTALHQRIMLQLTGSGQIAVPKEIENYWKSLSSVFTDVNDVELTEKRVYHPFLCYRGVFDCLAKYKGELVVIDWKTSSKVKSSLSDLYDEPLQTAAYAGAVNFDPSLSLSITKFAVVIAYESGQPATVHAFNQKVCMEYWNYFLKRLNTYWVANKA